MTEQSWRVHVVELEKNKLVVDLGGGGEEPHLVNLFDIMSKIRIENPKAPSFGSKEFNECIGYFGDGPGEKNNLIKQQRLLCSIPLTQIRIGGRPTKSRRPPRRRRATRRTTRHRRV
jgi:hypothetical protein